MQCIQGNKKLPTDMPEMGLVSSEAYSIEAAFWVLLWLPDGAGAQVVLRCPETGAEMGKTKCLEMDNPVTYALPSGLGHN